LWVPSLYLAEGVPYAMVNTVAAIMFKRLGVPNASLAFFTSCLALPWVLKPLWSPVVDNLKTRRAWILWTQFSMCAGLGAVALVVPLPHFFAWSLGVLALVALISATHDIAADGFYMLALAEREQAFFSGIRSTFYRVASICAQGGLVVLAGEIERRTGKSALAWSTAFLGSSGLFLLLGFYHRSVLPAPARDRLGRAGTVEEYVPECLRTFGSFFQKPGIGRVLAFLLLYRFGEAQLVRIAPLFLLDPPGVGGMGLTTEQVGVVYNTVGPCALLAGGIAGGWLISRLGLRACLWPMVIVMHAPDAAFIFLSQTHPHNLWTIGSCVGVEQFGYGFGFTAYMMFMIYVARGAHQTAHYAICTGFMALGLMAPQMWSGALEKALGYPHFFIWVMLATLPGFAATALIRLEPEFGRRQC
jgi:PAT family beta-lactamase induction signal transducer AmpG